MKKTTQIRSISRALSILKAVNKNNEMTMMELSKGCNLPYATTVRIVKSLISEGMIASGNGRKTYRPTAMTQTLSYGFQEGNLFASMARPEMVALTKDIGWPAALLTRVAESMVIRDSTHSLTTMTFSQYYPGWSVPIWFSASGRVHLAYCNDEERQNIIETTLKREKFDDFTGEKLDRSYINSLIAEIREQGFATTSNNRFSMDPGKTSSIAIPVERGGKYYAALAIIYFSSAMKPKVAIDRYWERMKMSGAAISNNLLAGM